MTKYSHDEHEDIVDSVRQAFGYWNCAHETENTFFIIEHYVAKLFQPGLEDESLRADGYIGLDDGFPCILLEVGKMPDGKWSHCHYSVDDKPARVLRIGFDRHAFILHPRNTQREQHFLWFLNQFLEHEQELEAHRNGHGVSAEAQR